MKRYTQQGAAIILAMLVVALATTTAVFMAWQQSMWTQHVGNLTARSQANALARGAIDWTRGVLAEDARKGNVDHLGEDWARRLVALPVVRGRGLGYQQAHHEQRRRGRVGPAKPFFQRPHARLSRWVREFAPQHLGRGDCRQGQPDAARCLVQLHA